ncbi:TolC family protein [Clostridium sp. AF02-29]|uniref:TolC family protein n=2 Tax=Clostridium sp. AF02-29 TaxID=2292993 RepID=UPI0023524AB2|nr:TolC family protein [Clostridium sp. AF02-29]
MNQNRRLCLTRRIASGVAACSLGVFLAAGAPVQVLAASPQFAYSTEKWASLQDDKLEFDEIADRIHEYNSTVEKNRIEYKDYQGKDSNEIESSIEYPDSDDANYGSALAAAQRSEASATQMREQGDNNVDDANVKAWGYTQTEKSLVQQAQNLMIQYWNAQENLKSVQNQVSKAEKDYETANLKLSSGSATQTDVLDAKETLLKAQASITTAESNIASTKESLCQMLGWKYGASVEICALPDPQEQMSASINFEEDIAKAQENNYQLKILARQVNNAMTSTLKEQYQTTLTSGKEAVKSNVQSAYQNLKLSEAQYEQAKRSLELEEKTKQTNDRKLAAGLISQNAYQSATYSYESASVAKETAAMSLLQAQFAYQWAVDGLASTQ